MLIAINILIFLCGFSLATYASLNSKGPTPRLRRFFEDLRRLFEKLGLSSSVPLGETSIEDQIYDGDLQAYHGDKFLFTRDQVEQTFAPDTWQREAYEEMKSRITAKGQGKIFPCVYATMGFKENGHRYVFLPSADPSEPRCVRILGEALRAYIPQSRLMGNNTSMVIICNLPKMEHSLEEYNTMFWGMLRGLRIFDTKEWPVGVPSDTTSEKWTFCFDGVPLFPVALTPMHKQRHSRWAPSLLIALQPKWVLDILLATPEKRQAATSKVRSLIEKYDDVEVSPDLTAYGEPGTSEVNQLFLLDDNDNPHGQCPFTDLDR